MILFESFVLEGLVFYGALIALGAVLGLIVELTSRWGLTQRVIRIIQGVLF